MDRKWITISGIILIFIVIIVIIAVLRGVAVAPARCDHSDLIPASISVEEGKYKIIGLNTDNTSLTFGKVSAGASVRRFIKVQYSKDAVVTIKPEGIMKDWGNISEQNFKLEANRSKDISFMVIIPMNVAPGNYIGSVLFCFRES